ncbi:MAG: asparagine synthase B [Halobacteriovoraceae bacterium]|nr:asparagine synthase B [Halobacteriovoraceae bacterium]
MCGIIAFYQKSPLKLESQKSIIESSLKKMSHRGPDESHIYQSSDFSKGLGHTRLSIIDPSFGAQPFLWEDLQWIHNGEIYNHAHFREEEFKSLFDQSDLSLSDSAIIGPLYKKYGTDFVSKLDGVFSIVILDGDKIIAARDPLGVKPLFYGFDDEERMWFASEMKALSSHCREIHTFPPGTLYTSDEGFIRYYEPQWFESKEALGPFTLQDKDQIKELLRDKLVTATKKRLMTDVPLGALLSGGLDSSLVAAIAARELKKTGKRLTTFSVGLKAGTHDLLSAAKVAEFIGSDHKEIIFDVEEGISLLRTMITLLETFDVTTIRASTPMFIMSKVIRDLGYKVVLSGEGADEIFGGYLYFSHAPSADEFQKECVRRIKRLHTSDLLRADRSTMGASIEARVPFLDKAFLDVAMSIDPSLKMIRREEERCEKWILRSSFSEESLIPDEILWRQKEQFSDGVGYSWVDGLKEYAESIISDADFSKREELFPYLTPTTKEAFLYRKIFSEVHPHGDIAKQAKRWIPKWQDYDVDPSGRANDSHTSTYHPLEKLEA